MCTGYRGMGNRQFDNPKVKLNVSKLLNLPQIRKEEQQFQSMLNSFDSEQNRTPRDSSYFLKTIAIRSMSKNSKKNSEEKKLKPEYTLYGFSRIKSDRYFLYSRKSSVRSQFSDDSEECDNIEWFEKCQNMQAPHGKVKFFERKTNSYFWQDIIVLDYDDSKQQFLVQQYPKGIKKKVGRLQIQFQNQKQTSLNKSAQMLKYKLEKMKVKIQDNKDLELIGDHQVNELPQTIRDRLQNQFDIQNRKTDILQNLLDEIAQLYLDKNKECFYQQKILKYRQIFNPQQRFPRYEKIKYQLISRGPLFRLNSIQAVQKLQFRCEILRGFIFHPENLTYPLSFDDFVQIVQQLDLAANFKKQRHYMLSEIQDCLRQFSFVLSEYSKFENSELQKIIIRLNLQYRDNLFSIVTQQFSLLKSFYGQFQLKIQETKIKSISFMLLRGTTKRKKTIQKKLKKHSDDNLDEYELLIEPTLQMVIDILTLPIQRILECIKAQSNLEPDLLTLLILKPKPLFSDCGWSDTLTQFQTEITKIIQDEYMKCQDLISKFDQFKFLLAPLTASGITRIFGIDVKDKPLLSQLQFQSIYNNLKQIQNAHKDICFQVCDDMHMGLFTLQSLELKLLLTERATKFINILLNKLITIINHNLKLLHKQYQTIYDQIITIPNQEEELVKLKSLIQGLKLTLEKQAVEMKQIQSYFDIFDELKYTYDIMLYQDYIQLLNWPQQIWNASILNQEKMEEQERTFLNILENEKITFNAYICDVQILFDNIKYIDHYQQDSQQIQLVKNLIENLETAAKTIEDFNRREKMFEQPVTQYSQLDFLQQEFQPYKNIWAKIESFQKEKHNWLFGSFKKLDHKTIMIKLNEYVKHAQQNITFFTQTNNDSGTNLLKEYQKELEEFQSILWVVESLGIEAFHKKPAFWRDVFREGKIQNFDPKESFPLQLLISRGILNSKKEIIQLSIRAEKGWNIEKRLNEMIDKLCQVKIELQEYQETFLFKNFEDVQTIFDEQLNVLTMLKSQQQINMVMGKANQLEYKMILIQNTLEYGNKCQKDWKYLDPIFTSLDIKKNLPAESNQFLQVDKYYRECMKEFQKQSILWDCIENEKLKITFSTCQLMLDIIQKSLNVYLEQKRTSFPRFYFLSDEELVEILAQTKDPQSVQKYAYKCFEGIHQLKIYKNQIIVGMSSIHDEQVALDTSIDVTVGNRKGNVEQWLSDLQSAMQITIKKISGRATKDYNTNKKEYILKWPTQVVLLGNSIKFTRTTESAIKEQQKLTLKTYLDILTKELKDTVSLVRNDNSEILKTVLESMVVMEVHSKDIVMKLTRLEIKSVNDFEWISQLRYYTDETNDFRVKILNAQVNYGFEYLGKVTRLVITSLTDRCQRTLMSAINLNYGGAPEGPAGTGKTETVKDLAKAIGMPCIVFNCSDGLNYVSMGKFFKGLASSGQWCCFDEFNRINPEVLSVVAQQIFTIQRAIKEDKDQFQFEGEIIKLVKSCAINITMNPGYAGRSELPDNLKMLFRPCVMMVPDFAMIAEIYLYSIGFENARELSSKIVTCLKLCTQQLSPQDHYDFGMRALKAILNTAKQLFNGTEEVICLTALLRVNVPKFTQTDLQLFIAIISDLFPNLNPLDSDTLQLEDACNEVGVVMDEKFLEKCEQLQNNINVRNGVMNIGLTLTGKSTVLSTLGKYQNAIILKLNPKAITIDQIYGYLDPETKQWDDGVLSILIRNHINSTQIVWIVFDGPVDSLWIENLNTVLDDNKKLCLTSGEILKIPENMCMIFEIENLSCASPATVSRCGMVYYTIINWYLIVQSYKFQSGFDQDYLVRRLRFLIDHSLAWIKEFSDLVLIDIENILVLNMLRMFNKALSYISLEQDNYLHDVDNYMIFSLVWSIGAALEEKYKPIYNEFLHRLIRINKSGCQTMFPDDLELQLPQNDRVEYFQYVYDKQQWIKWVDIPTNYTINKELEFHQIIVPTKEIIRNNYFCQFGVHLLLYGPTGTAKSLSMIQNQNFQINCSGQTTANSIQKLIETKVNKRRKKGHYASEEGHIHIFIDDLNMPKREIDGSQSAIELLRQWIEMGGWFDLINKEFKYMIDITLLTAMRNITGDHDQVSMRLLRHFNIIFTSEFDNNCVHSILSVFFDWIFLKLTPPIDVLEIKQQLVVKTIEFYDKIKAIFRPTPTKNHYVYNLSDVFKLFQGISKVNKLPTKFYFVKLWAHEFSRIFSDRLVDDLELQQFENLQKDFVHNFGFTIYHPSNLIWVKFLENHYEEALNIQTVKEQLQKLIDDHNSINQLKFNVILFTSAVLHISRISRIISNSQGHALLIGMSGTGRMTLSKIATMLIYNQPILTVDPRTWNESLLSQLKILGQENQIRAIAFNDYQFVNDWMVEDVCDLMSHGEVPHLFPPEERIKIQEEIPYQRFIHNCRFNTHLILCMQPFGDSLRKNIRNFPKLITCSTIYWMTGWPMEALESIGNQFLPQNLVKMAVDIHSQVVKVNENFRQELRRQYYVTPSQYLLMIQVFNKIYNDKIKEAQTYFDQFESGVKKIIHTEEDVEKIKQQLEEFKPKLALATQENNSLLNVIATKQVEADIKKQVCEQEQLICNEKREAANYLKDDCQNQLNAALPLLQKATEALEKISKDDMILLKSFTSPPPSAAIVMEGLCYAFQEDDLVKPKSKEPPSLQDYWDYAKKSLLNDKLIKRIKSIKLPEIMSINRSKIVKLQYFVKNPLFEKDRVFNASTAAGNLAQWIRAVLSAYEAVEIIEPKKIQLAEAEANLKETEDIVKDKVKLLNDSLNILVKLNEELSKAESEKQIIEKKVNKIQDQLIRAEKLTNGLGEEKIRWKQKAEELRNQQQTIYGDCLLAGAVVAYLGPYPIQYRENCMDFWKSRFTRYIIRHSENYSFQKHMSDPITISQWISQKLPNDQFSIDNAIILKNTLRWPLMIDPQLQANHFIKNNENLKSLLIINGTTPTSNYQLPLEHAIQIGYAVLLENVGQNIDPIFDPILQFKFNNIQSNHSLRFGDKLLEVSNDFKLYITTKLNNPHYQPQVCMTVTILNFIVTSEGLTDQMLNILVKTDEPIKEEQRIQNIQLFFQNQHQQQETQNKILQLLSESTGNLLDNESLIEVLQKSKEDGKEISKTLMQIETDTKVFNQIRDFYKTAAQSVANIYFVLNDLSQVEPTYQWSLEFFIQLYQRAIKEAGFNKAKRIQNIIDKFQMLFYTSISRSLLEKDKLIFRFMLCLRITQVPIIEIRACVMGPTITEFNIGMPLQYKWMTKGKWIGIVDLEQRFPEQFKGICTDIKQNTEFWECFQQSPVAFEIQVRNLQQFHVNMLIKILKPDLFIQATNHLIKMKLGKFYLENPPQILEQYFQESNNQTPLLCIVTPGADPRNGINALAEKLNFQEKFNYVSLGQGQGQLAIRLIKQGMQLGKWVLLQNCHVAISFMPELEQIYENFSKNPVHRDFRLWLTSLPTNVLPQNVILRCIEYTTYLAIKMTYELPRGLKNNMLRSYFQQEPETFETCKKLFEFKTLLFSLTLFHACLLERRKYGSVGWNIPYSFSQHDLSISKEQLKYFLETQHEIQWDALSYIFTEINYGGRVTDPEDRKLLKVILADFIKPDVLQNNYHFFQDYQIPNAISLKNYINYIHTMPSIDPPQIFGLHENAEIQATIIETQSLSSSILQLLPRTLGNSSLNSDKIVKAKCKEMLQLFPHPFDTTSIQEKYPINTGNSLNIVLISELARFNKLVILIQTSLSTLMKGLDGIIHISEEFQEIYNKIFDNQVPYNWSKVSYPSSKLLGAWIFDLIERLKFMADWVNNGQPICYWLGGLYFVQGFLTGQMQYFSRKRTISINQLRFQFKFLQKMPQKIDDDGFYVNKLYFNGARFDFQTNSLEDPDLYTLYSEAPIIQFIPKLDLQQNDQNHYDCPLYTTSMRSGTVSALGLSSNFIIHIDVPIRQSSNFWKKRGLAMVLQID